MKIAKLINAEETDEDIKRLISIHQKYSKTAIDNCDIVGYREETSKVSTFRC
ncbi:MAG: hypothetical protein WAM14_12270 [Candidatus Nitrosopolaris sp.]